MWRPAPAGTSPTDGGRDMVSRGPAHRDRGLLSRVRDGCLFRGRPWIAGVHPKPRCNQRSAIQYDLGTAALAAGDGWAGHGLAAAWWRRPWTGNASRAPRPPSPALHSGAAPSWRTRLPIIRMPVPPPEAPSPPAALPEGRPRPSSQSSSWTTPAPAVRPSRTPTVPGPSPKACLRLLVTTHSLRGRAAPLRPRMR